MSTSSEKEQRFAVLKQSANVVEDGEGKRIGIYKTDIFGHKVFVSDK